MKRRRDITAFRRPFLRFLNTDLPFRTRVNSCLYRIAQIDLRNRGSDWILSTLTHGVENAEWSHRVYSLSEACALTSVIRLPRYVTQERPNADAVSRSHSIASRRHMFIAIGRYAKLLATRVSAPPVIVRWRSGSSVNGRRYQPLTQLPESQVCTVAAGSSKPTPNSAYRMLAMTAMTPQAWQHSTYTKQFTGQAKPTPHNHLTRYVIWQAQPQRHAAVKSNLELQYLTFQNPSR